jgi:hypothetical protein
LAVGVVLASSRHPWRMLMSDDLKKRGPADRSRVNVNEKWEVEWWCNEFRCTEAELRAAVKAVGVMADKVRAEINRVKGRK